MFALGAKTNTLALDLRTTRVYGGARPATGVGWDWDLALTKYHFTSRVLCSKLCITL